MTTIDELESAHFTAAQHCAEEIWKEHGDEKLPVDLFKILEKLSLQYLGTTELPQSVRGMCAEMVPGEGGIIYKENTTDLSKRWTIAHEIGHWCLGHVSTFGAPTSNLPHNQEKEADAFAGALLIPPSDFRQFVKAHNPSIDQVQERYNVTKNIAGVAAMRPGILKHITA